VYAHFAQGIGARGAAAHAAWKEMFARYSAEYPDLAREFGLIDRRELPEGWAAAIPSFPADPKGIATRDSSGKVLNALAARIPWLIGGAADLAPSTKTNLANGGSFEADDYAGRNFHFGVREHAMGAICNGMALSNLRVFGSGFLIFSDYMRGAIRLSAISELPVVWVFTHDSIGVGEDGPTHQPIEHLASLRGIPGMHTIRPADANEMAEAWRIAMTEQHTPTCFALSRQPLPTIDRSKYNSAAGLARGAYVLADPPDGAAPELILMGTGSEIALCLEAYETLTAEGARVRGVWMPSWDIFEQQDEAYRRSVFPDNVRARVAVEQAATLGWDRYAGVDGAIIGMHTFGASAPLKSLLEHFGFTPAKVLEAARAQLATHAALRRAAE
jgi:transketolase